MKEIKGTVENNKIGLLCEYCREEITTRNICVFQWSIPGGIKTVITCDAFGCFNHIDEL